MTHRGRRPLILGVVAVTAGLLAATTPAMASAMAPAAPSTAEVIDHDIADRLKSVPGLTVVSEDQSPIQGYRSFVLNYRQPVDHRNPAAGVFQQRVQLLHKATNRPMVLYTNGYEVPAQTTLSEPAQLLAGNQLVVGQRFFTDSRPDPADWSKLDIWQAATDHHRLVGALKAIYPEKWLASGIAKGGATAVYHRRFYPHDVAGVIAYGAPNNVDDADDSRYNAFLETVSTPACRDALKNVQRAALDRRAELVPRLAALAAQNNLTFTQILGNADKAFELVVVHLPYAYWQFFLQEDCRRIPGPAASADEIWEFLDEIVSWQTPADQTLGPRAAWFYQAVNQLGLPVNTAATPRRPAPIPGCARSCQPAGAGTAAGT